MSLVEQFLNEGIEGLVNMANVPDTAEVTLKATKAGDKAKLEIETPDGDFEKTTPNSVLTFLASTSNAEDGSQAVARVEAGLRQSHRSF